jgi:hypothetical protein
MSEPSYPLAEAAFVSRRNLGDGDYPHTKKNQTTNDEVELDEMGFLVPRTSWQNSSQIVANGSSGACVRFPHVVNESEER